MRERLSLFAIVAGLALIGAVYAGPSIATVSPLPGGTATAVYSQAFSASGGAIPYRWSVVDGALPDGLSMNADGSIAGTPTTPGTFSFGVQVTDSQGIIDRKTFSITINSAAAAPIISTQSPLPAATVDAAYSQTLAASGGDGPYTWAAAVQVLPPGLTLQDRGSLNGTPSAAGTFNFTVKVTDRVGVSVTKIFSITVNPSPREEPSSRD